MISFAVKTQEAEANKPKHLTPKGFIPGFIKAQQTMESRCIQMCLQLKQSLYMTYLV